METQKGITMNISISHRFFTEQEMTNWTQWKEYLEAWGHSVLTPLPRRVQFSEVHKASEILGYEISAVRNSEYLLVLTDEDSKLDMGSIAMMGISYGLGVKIIVHTTNASSSFPPFIRAMSHIEHKGPIIKLRDLLKTLEMDNARNENYTLQKVFQMRESTPSPEGLISNL